MRAPDSEGGLRASECRLRSMSESRRESVLGWPRRLAAVALLLVALPVCAKLDVVSVRARLDGGELLARTTLDVDIGPQAEEALDRGIPLVILVDVALYRIRPIVWDHRLARWTFRVELRYHALSNLYVLHAPDFDEFETYRSAADALKAAAGPRTIAAPLPVSLSRTDTTLGIAVRAHLDIEALPPPLRMQAYLSPAWRLSSGWHRWALEQ